MGGAVGEKAVGEKDRWLTIQLAQWPGRQAEKTAPFAFLSVIATSFVSERRAEVIRSRHRGYAAKGGEREAVETYTGSWARGCGGCAGRS